MNEPTVPAPALAGLLAANEGYSAPSFEGARPARAFALLTCMDARIDPAEAFGLAAGDAHVIRNAGGRATDDALRSLMLSVHLLGTREVGIVHHTGCAMEVNEDEQLVERIVAAGGPAEPQGPLHTFKDLEAGVTEDVDAVVGCGLLRPDVLVWGAVYDVDNGRLNVVVPARRIEDGGPSYGEAGRAARASSRPV